MKIVQKMCCLLFAIGFSNCVTFVQVDKVKNMKDDFIPKIGTSRKVSVFAIENKKHPDAEYGNYVTSMESGAKNGFLSNKYFSFQSLSDRVGFSNLFNQKQYDAIQKKFSIGVLYVMNITPIKNILCSISSETRYRQGQCTKWVHQKDGTSYCQQYEQIPYQVNISKITFQFQIDGKLVNLKNGNSIQMLSPQEASITRDGALCSADNSGLKHMFQDAAYRQSHDLSKAISPISEMYSVKLYKDLDGVPDNKENKEQRNQIADLLADGLKDIRNKKFDDGEKKISEAYKISQKKSAAAAWNLGILAWKKMELQTAFNYLTESFAADANWKNPLRTDIYNNLHEQLRILQPAKKK